MFHRNFSSSQWESNAVNTPASFPSTNPGINVGEFKLGDLAYQDKLTIPTANYNDLQFRKMFCRAETKRY